MSRSVFFLHLNILILNNVSYEKYLTREASQVVLVVKNPPASAGDIRDMGSIPGSGRFPGGGHGNLLQYSCLEMPIGRGAWWAIVHELQRVKHDLSDLVYVPAHVNKSRL